jgi:superfamily II DNA or RNA helicase
VLHRPVEPARHCRQFQCLAATHQPRSSRNGGFLAGTAQSALVDAPSCGSQSANCSDQKANAKPTYKAPISEDFAGVITNIGQLQGAGNRWLQALPDDFFDLILFDEGHHNVAASWSALRTHFPAARIVNFSATPARADGRIMSGRIIYSYPIFRAIQEGYVKRLKAVVLNPQTLRYVREEDGQEIEVDLDEVRRLGEEEADFRRSIVTSSETLNTIVDASIRELRKLRTVANDQKLKIIASALNYRHCIQVVEDFRSRCRLRSFTRRGKG